MNESKKIFNLHTIVKYESAVPRPTREEYDALSESIRLRGQQVPIVCNSKGIILDGHTRFEILSDHNIEPEYVVKDFPSEEEEYQYVIESNLNRRQLTIWQKAECYFDLIDYYRRLAKESRTRGLKQNKKVPYAQPVGNVAEKFAKSLGIGERTMSNIIFIKDHIKGRALLLEQLRHGTITVTEGRRRIDKALTGKEKSRSRKQSEIWLQCPHCKKVNSMDRYKKVVQPE